MGDDPLTCSVRHLNPHIAVSSPDEREENVAVVEDGDSDIGDCHQLRVERVVVVLVDLSSGIWSTWTLCRIHIQRPVIGIL
jgi:hypothetical protein